MTEFSSGPAAHRSYDPARYGRLFAIEDRHFWFRARNQVISTLVCQITAGLASGYRVLEVGSGTGNVLRVLERACPCGIVVGMDLFAEGLQYASQRTSCPLVRGDMNAPPFGAQFDLIGLFDVLEHLPDDLQILRDLRAMLAPGGTLLLTTPAHRSLWSYFDEASHHCRRYETAELESKLLRTGYRVEYLTQYMASIFPLVWLGRRLSSLIGVSGDLRVMPVVNDVLALLLAQETRLIARRRRLPIGTSLLAVARKNSDTV